MQRESWATIKAALAEAKRRAFDEGKERATEPVRGGGQDAPFVPGVRAMESVNDWLGRKIVDPLAQRGYPNLGAALATPPAVIADMLIPQAGADLNPAAAPIGSFRRALNGRKALAEAEQKLLGLGTNAERAANLERQNAAQAVREKIKGQPLADKLKREGQHYEGPKPDVQYLGRGVDMAAYSVPGDVVVKSPRSANGEDKLVSRFGIESRLADAGLAPETFVVETSRNKHMVQPKAGRLLEDAGKEHGYGYSDDIRQRLREDTRETLGIEPADLHEHNIAEFPDGWKIIDAGHFPDAYGDRMSRGALHSPNFVTGSWGKTMRRLREKAPGDTGGELSGYVRRPTPSRTPTPESTPTATDVRIKRSDDRKAAEKAIAWRKEQRKLRGEPDAAPGIQTRWEQAKKRPAQAETQAELKKREPEWAELNKPMPAMPDWDWSPRAKEARFKERDVINAKRKILNDELLTDNPKWKKAKESSIESVRPSVIERMKERLRAAERATPPSGNTSDMNWRRKNTEEKAKAQAQEKPRTGAKSLIREDDHPDVKRAVRVFMEQGGKPPEAHIIERWREAARAKK